MSFNLELAPDLEARLVAEADSQGCSVDSYAHQLLDEHVPGLTHETPVKDPQKAIDLLQSWIDEGDEEEQAETLDYLIEALDADRLSDRLLFPLELRGQSW